VLGSIAIETYERATQQNNGYARQIRIFGFYAEKGKDLTKSLDRLRTGFRAISVLNVGSCRGCRRRTWDRILPGKLAAPAIKELLGQSP